MNTKPVVPNGMLDAAADAWNRAPDGDFSSKEVATIIVEAALLWQRDNAPEPTLEWLDDYCAGGSALQAQYLNFFRAWIHRMYDAVEPEVKLPPLKHGGDYYESIIAQLKEREQQLLAALTELEAFRRGQKASKQ